MTGNNDKTMPTILVVDDAAVERTLAGGLVSNAGWEVIYAVDGLDALRQIENNGLAAAGFARIQNEPSQS